MLYNLQLSVFDFDDDLVSRLDAGLFQPPALQADLRSLQRTPLPLAWDFNAPQTRGALIGILYTLEGSTLGGQFIARHLSQLPGPKLPRRFFTGYGELTPQRWDEFLRFVETQSAPSDCEDAIATASSLFGAIKTHLDGVSHAGRDGDGLAVNRLLPG